MSTEMLTKYIGGNIGLGGYSEYTLADEQLCFKLPPGLAREEAVTTPLGACVAYLGLFSKSCLNVDIERGPNVSVLIWGGSCELQFIASNSLIFLGPDSFFSMCRPIRSSNSCYVQVPRHSDLRT